MNTIPVEILLVEDNPDDVELTLRALNTHKLANRVKVVSDGVEALAYLQPGGADQPPADGFPKVVLLDLKLPRVGGLEVLRQLKASETTRDIPVVVLTSSHEERDIVESYHLEAILAAWHPDIAVLDMDHVDSTPLLGRLVASDHLTRQTMPTIGLTRRGDLQIKLRAFDLGVDDILTVPFSAEELLARAVALTRRASGTEGPIIPTIRLGEIEIDILGREVRTGNSVIHLSGIEQSLLYLLASRAGQVVTPDEILDVIWGTDLVDENHLVDRHIRSLRIKLQDDFRRPRFIATVPSRGYRFIPTFTEADWQNAPASPATRPH